MWRIPALRDDTLASEIETFAGIWLVYKICLRPDLYLGMLYMYTYIMAVKHMCVCHECQMHEFEGMGHKHREHRTNEDVGQQIKLHLMPYTDCAYYIV